MKLTIACCLPFVLFASVTGWPAAPGAHRSVLNSPACYPDCDCNGALNIDDIDCFAAAFLAGDPYADCNRDSAFTIDDIDCFAAAYTAGCD